MPSISCSEALPSLRKAGIFFRSRPWDAAFDASANDHLVEVAKAIQAIQRDAFENGHPALVEISNGILRDLIALERIVPRPHTRVIQFLRFLACVLPAERCVAYGDKGHAYDWLMWSLDANYDAAVGRSQHWFLPMPLPHDLDVAWICCDQLDTWSFAFFTLARTFGGLDGIATQLCEVCWTLNEKIFAVRPGLMPLYALGAIATYSINAKTSLAQKFAVKIYDLWNDPTFPFQLRGSIGVLLTTGIAEHTPRTANEWAALVLRQYSDLLVEHEPLQLMAVAIENLEEWRKQRVEILTEVARLAGVTREGATRASVTSISALEERVDVIFPLVFKLSEWAQLDDVVAVLCGWYSGKAEQYCSSTALYLAPSHDGGVLALGPTGVTFIRAGDDTRALDRLVGELSQAMNEFYAVSGAPRHGVDYGVRHGIPALERGNAMERAMREHYRPDAVGVALGGTASYESLIVFPNVPGPVQAIFEKAGLGAPLQTSFTLPSRERNVRVVSVWAGQSFYTDYEVAALRALGNQKGWDVRVRVPSGHAERDRCDFRDFYEDKAADVLWVIGHGRFVAHEPSRSGIDLDANNVVSILDISSFRVPKDQRRLLVLNICNGATSQLHSGAAKIGLAQEVACSNQAVIGHMWPIDPVVGIAFGCLLALHLDGRPFYSSFVKSRDTLRRGVEVLPPLEAALGADSETVKRIKHRAVDFVNILHWGCPVFLT